MSKVDTTGWNQFRLADLGFVCYHGCRLNKSERIDGNLLFLTAGKENMGAYGYIGNDRDAYSEAISVDMFGNCFYHRELCAGDDNVYFFVNAQVSSLSKQFIATCIDAYCRNMFSYSRQFRQPDADDLAVSLPATPDGQPDWAYMDAYMSEVLKKEEVFAEHLASLTAEAVADGHKLDTSGWKAFRLTDLFVMRNTKSIVQQSVVFDSGDVPYVTSQAVDNGVAGYISCPCVWLEQGNCLLIGGKTSTVFYQALDFCSNDSHNIACYAKESISDRAYLFLQSILSDFLRQHYSWGNSLSMKSLVFDEIYLPVTSDGQPDWAWMEQYMQQQMDKAEALVEHLDAVWNG